MMISLARELRVESGRVSHRWRMRVVCHSYGGLVGTEIEMMVSMHAGQCRRVVGRMSGNAEALPECVVIH